MTSRPPTDPSPAAAGPTGPTVRRVAGVLLRGRRGRLPARAYWPSHPGPGPAPALLVLFTGVAEPAGLDVVDRLCRGLCAGAGLQVLSVSHREPRDATAATHWAADHAADLGADPGRLLVGGVGAGARAAAAVVREARDEGWPVVVRQVLVRPVLQSPRPDPLGPDGDGDGVEPVPGLAPATVVTVDGVDGPVGTRVDDGWEHAALLRHAGVAVDELRYGGPPAADRLVDDLVRALRRTIDDRSVTP
jgi:hypothetical protein